MNWIMGIDLGATRIKALACDSRGEAWKRHLEPTRDGVFTDGLPAWASAVRRIVAEFEKERGQRAAAIGLSAPGLAAVDGRSITFMPGRMQGLEGFDWPAFLGRPDALVLNDAQAALLGEVWRGAARGTQNALLLTLGTGVGGAIWSEGRLLRGHRNRAGHLGHICLNPQGEPGITRVPGSLEDAIGESTLLRRSGGRFHSTAELLESAARGDLEAARVWATSIRALACGLASVINVCDPERVVLGGGIAEAGPALFDPLQQELDKVEWQLAGTRVQLVKAQLGEWAGAYGVAWEALRRLPAPARAGDPP
jgi:glucokinase